MWEKIKNGFRTFMRGRHGTDQLSLALLIAGIVMSLMTNITGLAVFYYIGMVAYIYAIFRMFSRNNVKRNAENYKYLTISQKIKSEISQFFARLKNIKKYRYFRCPECKSRLRLPRKVGEVTVTCGKCRHQFKQKA